MRHFVVIASFPLWLICASAPAQQSGAPPSGVGIYSCVDSKGRTITADRPIADCVDREQRELNPSGTTRRKVDPTLTAREQADRDERDRLAAQAALRAQEERRRERALLIRYPTPATHDRDRAEALTQIDVVIQAARKRLSELGDDRRKLEEEMEFYSKDISKAPGSIRRQMDDIAQSVAVQNRFIADQEDEKRRVNSRFDEERGRLSKLWPTPVSAPAAKTTSSK